MTEPQDFKVVLEMKRNLRTNILFQMAFSSYFWEELRVGYSLEIHSVDQ